MKATLEGQGWVEAHRETWDELEESLRWIDVSGRHWTPRDVESFTQLYRRAASDLLVARAGRASAQVAEYLNDLLGRCYVRLYTWSRTETRSPWMFMLDRYPRLVRKYWKYLALSILLFLGGFSFGFLRMTQDDSLRYFLLPIDHQSITPAQRVAEDTQPTAALDQVSGVAGRSVSFSMFLSLHNVRIALLAFALGLFFGIFTCIVLFYNGMTMGALAADYYLAGSETWWFFWAWILPHGIPELCGVFLAASGGFVLGRAMMAPGRFTTREAVARAARPALGLFLGTIPLFIGAGLIEATFSQIHPPVVSYGFKLLMAMAVLAAIVSYFMSFGRTEDGEKEPDDQDEQVWHIVRPGGVLEILTPEHVIFRYRLAGLVSRALAAALDLLWIILLAIFVGALLGLLMQEILPGFSFIWGFQIGILLVTLGYFGFLERAHKSTQGKSALKLKVLDQRGLGIGMSQRILRTVFRVVDMLPGLYLLGFISALMGGKRQRLGDRVAGTLVIQEGTADLPLTPQMERDWYLEELSPDRRKKIMEQLTGEERDLLLQLALRRHRLSLQSRLRLYKRARAYFEQRTGWEKPGTLPDERYITGLAWAVMPQQKVPPRQRRRTRKERRR